MTLSDSLYLKIGWSYLKCIKFNIFMKLKNIDLAGGVSYKAPAVSILDVQVEGVLCESGITIEDWENDDELLDFD